MVVRLKTVAIEWLTEVVFYSLIGSDLCRLKASVTRPTENSKDSFFKCVEVHNKRITMDGTPCADKEDIM